MAGRPDPKRRRRRGKLPTRKQLGERCQVCGSSAHVERMHLLGGAHKEDDPDLIMLGCGDFGDCKVHPRSHRGPDRTDALMQIRHAMNQRQRDAVIARVGSDEFDRRFPEANAICVALDCWEGIPCPIHAIEDGGNLNARPEKQRPMGEQPDGALPHPAL